MSEFSRCRDLRDEDANATNKNGDNSFEICVGELKSQFYFCKSTKKYQDALDINETYWEKMSNLIARDGANCCERKLIDKDGDEIDNETSRDGGNSCQTNLLDKDGDEIANETSRHGTTSCQKNLLDKNGNEINLVTTFGEYIVKKIELLCEMGRLEEARERCLRALADLKEKTVHLPNRKAIKLAHTEFNSDLGMVTESLYVCLSTVSVKEFNFEKAFEILDRNVLEGLEIRLDAVKKHHSVLRNLMADSNYIAKESLEDDFKDSNIIVNPFLENHYIDENGKFYVQSLDKALRIAKNGDSIFLKNGDHHLGHAGEDAKMLLEKNVTFIGESTNQSTLIVSFHISTMGEIQFKRLNIWIVFPIHVSQGKINFESCLVNSGSCDPFFTLDSKQAEIDLHLCSFTSFANSSLVQLKNSNLTIKMDIRNCSFTDFKFIITDFRETSLRGGFELQIESCCFFGIQLAMIALDTYYPSQKEVNTRMDMIQGVIRREITLSFTLTYPTSVVVRNCSVEVCSNFEDVSYIMDIDNASHVLIETTKFNAKRVDTSAVDGAKRIKHGLHFANIQRVEITNVMIIREGNESSLACQQTFLENSPNTGAQNGTFAKVGWCWDDAAIQLTAVHEATIRDSIFNGFYYGISTRSIIPDIIFNKARKTCFTGVYNCQLRNMAVCVLLDSNETVRSIFVLSDISLEDSLVGVQVSETLGSNESVDILDTKFINIASPIVVPKILKKDAKDEKNLLGRLETKNLTLPDEGPQNVSRKKRRDDVIKNLMKAGVLNPTTSIPYLEKVFNPGGSYLEIANGRDLETFDFKESSTSDYQSDYDDSVD